MAKCSLCSCATAQQVRLPDNLPATGHRILVVVGGINATDVILGEAMASASGVKFKEIMNEQGFINTTYVRATMCAVNKVNAEVLKNCTKRIKDFAINNGFKYVMLLGTAQKGFLNLTGGVNAHRGKAIEKAGITYMLTYSPEACYDNPSLARVQKADLRYFKAVVEGLVTEPTHPWLVVDDDLDCAKMLEHICQSKVISYDVETTGLDASKDKLLMLGIGTPNCDYIIDFSKGKNIGIANLAFKTAKHAGVKTVAHNGRFDNKFLRANGVNEVYLSHDTYLMSYVLDESTPHDLKFLSKVFCGAGDYAIDTKNLNAIPTYEVQRYCALDCHYTLKLLKALAELLRSEPALRRIYTKIVMPGGRVLEDVEAEGIHVDVAKLHELKDSYSLKVTELNATLETLSGVADVNWGSPKQVAEILYKKLKLKPINKDRSTGKSVLVRLSQQHALPKVLLEYRRYKKALESFIEPWMEITKTDGKLHTQYNIARTATGRLSAQEPNLQQVPRINEIRSLICPHDGKVFIEADYSQIELRVAAFIAHAESMKNVYRKGGDIHTSTACKLAYTTAPTKEERTKAKAANFGFLYGMGWKSFKDYAYDNYGLELTDDEAMEMRRAFFQAYPELITWHETQRSVVRVHKKVVSPFGRVRHLFDVTSPDKAIASGAERQAINTPVQSMASDMTVLAMIELDKVLDSTKASIVGQIHDAILIEVDEDYADEALEITKLIMEDLPIEEIFGVKLDLPIVADAQISSSWGNKK